MRHWQPLHHARWRAFLDGLDAALRGLAPVTVAPTPALHVAVPPPLTAAPAPIALAIPAPAPVAVPPVPVAAPKPVETAFVAPVVPAPAPTLVAPPRPEPVAPIAAYEPVVPAVPTVSAVPFVHEVSVAPPAPFVADVTPAPEPAAELAPLLPAEPAPVARVQLAPPTPPTQDLAPRLPLPVPASVTSSTARAFFSALGWSGGGPVRFAPTPVPAPAPVYEQPVLAPVLTVAKPVPAPAPAIELASKSRSGAATYFRHLPWNGPTDYGEVITSIRVIATREDAQLDPRTAALPDNNPLLTGMLSAARTADRLATPAARPVAPTRARAYFSTLPWAHA